MSIRGISAEHAVRTEDGYRMSVKYFIPEHVNIFLYF
jgi:hypothetical protein